jgi:predicted dehydrogenase
MSNTINRRRFGRAAVAGTFAFPTIVSAVALGRQEGKPAASERLTLGFIGVGKQNRGHLGSFLNRPECQVVAVCDVDTTRRESAEKMVNDKLAGKSADTKACASFNDFRDLIERPEIDGVVIGTPDHWHVYPVMAAAAAKKDIYCEKPLSLTILEAKRMLDAVRKHDVVFQTGSQQRTEFGQKFRTACEAVRNGRIGRVQTVFVGVGPSSQWCDLPAEDSEPGLDWDLWLGPAPMRPYNSVLSPRGVHDHFPNWRAYREYSGGGYTDFGAHHFDIAQWGLGMDESGPVEITPPDDENAMVGCRYKYANGVEMIHGGPGGVVFVGDGGVIAVDRDRLDASPKKLLEEPLPDDAIRLGTATNHHQDWLDCIKTRKRPICDVEIGARSVTVCHLGNLAYWHRKPMKWDPKAWAFVGGTGDPKWLDCERRDSWPLPKV